jgi:hypothetical protein
MKDSGQKRHLLRLKIVVLVLMIATPLLIAATKLVGGFCNARVIQKIVETHKLIETPRSYHDQSAEQQFQKPETGFSPISSFFSGLKSIKTGIFLNSGLAFSNAIYNLSLFRYFPASLTDAKERKNQFFDSVYSWMRPPTGFDSFAFFLIEMIIIFLLLCQLFTKHNLHAKVLRLSNCSWSLRSSEFWPVWCWFPWAEPGPRPGMRAGRQT